MNLEPKVESKAIWWGGEYGGVIKDTSTPEVIPPHKP